MVRYDGKRRYLPDIDGLRALAILPVVAYHYDFPGIQGGFAGVDVFFVISGFLITDILLGEMRTGRYSILEFYERRVRRIFPAMFAMLLPVTVASVLLLLPVDLAGYGNSLEATAAFLSNFYFWHDAFYFDRAAEFKPLLHTWSLAIEEQFYVFFPPFLWAIGRISRRLIPAALAVAFCGSLALSVWAAMHAPAVDFYLLPTRAWELTIGALLAVGVLPVAANRGVRNVVSLIGLLFLIASIFLITSVMQFPGWIALLPCSGAALIIYASVAGGGTANLLLGTPPLVFIGKISYPLYLWHWPLIVLAKYLADRALSDVERVALFGLAVGLATLSWRYIERPFRKPGGVVGRYTLFAIAAGASGILACGGFLLARSGGLPSRFPSKVNRLFSYVQTPLMDKACFNQAAADIAAGKLCKLGTNAAAEPTSFIVWGDSHAFRTGYVVGLIAKKNFRAGLVAALGNCPPLIGVETMNHGCTAYAREVAGTIDRSGIHTVILSALWALYTEGMTYDQVVGKRSPQYLTDDRSSERSIAENRLVFARALRATVEHFTLAGRQVVVIGPVPEVSFSVPQRMAMQLIRGQPEPVGPSAAEFFARQRAVLSVLSGLKNVPHARVIYPHLALCRARCDVVRNGIPLYIDYNHLSIQGLLDIEPLLADIFGK